MAKPFKIILGIFGALIALIIVAAIVLPLLFDPNNFRDKISTAVEEQTGRSFEIGNIELKVFPWLRVALDDVSLGNAQGFEPDNFAAIKQVGVGVKLMPLLTARKVEIDSITLDGMELNLARNQEGVSNWDDLVERQSEADSAADTTEEQADDQASSFNLNDIDIAGVSITNAAVRFVDAQAGTAYRVEDLSLETGHLAPGEAFDIELGLTTTSDAPKAQARLRLKTHVIPSADGKRVTLEQLAATLEAQAAEMGVDATVTLGLNADADLENARYTISDLALEGTARGDAIPGKSQDFKLGGNLTYDQAADQMSFDNGRVEAAGMVVTTSIKGSGLSGDKPALSGPINVSKFSPHKLLDTLGIELETADDSVLSKASLSTSYSGSFTSAKLSDLKIVLDDTNIQGRVAVTDFSTQALDFALNVDQIDADRYLPPKTESADDAPSDTGGDSDINAIEIPTDALKQLNANGTVDIGTLKVNGLTMTDVRLKLSGTGKAARVQTINAKLYGGSVALDSRINPNVAQPTFAVKTDLNALNAAPFLQDLMGKDMVSGLGNLSFDLTTQGKTVGDLRRTLNGTLGFSVKDGAVNGFNLGQILRKGQALLAGQAAPTETESQSTDFTTLSATATIVNGVLKSDDLSAASPAFRVAGSGQVNLVKETINYVAKPTVVETTKGQGGKGLDELKGLTIPIKLSGSLYSPSYKLDIEDALKAKAKDQIKNKLAEELDLDKNEASEEQIKEKLNEKLGDLLFGNKKSKQATPTPSPSPSPAT